MKPHYCDTGYCQDKTFGVSEDLSTVSKSMDEDDGDWDNCMMVVPAMAPGTGQHTISMKLDSEEEEDIFCGVVREGALWNVDHADGRQYHGMVHLRKEWRAVWQREIWR